MRRVRNWLIMAAAALAAGCSATAGPASNGTTPSPSGQAPAPAIPAAVLVPPRCTNATAAAPALATVPTAMRQLRGTPFAVVASPDGRWSFVSLTSPGQVAVFRDSAHGTPALARLDKVPGAPLGEALTSDGRLLVVAEGGGAIVLDAARAERGDPKAVLGKLSSGTGGGAIEVALSNDSRYAFVSLEGSAEIAVFNLHAAVASGFRSPGFVGDIPVGLAPVGLAVSPDGRWLYATSQVAKRKGIPAGDGTLTVISVHQAETAPAGSVVATVAAGCGTVRVVTSADGRVIWVTARESNALLAFSAARLRTDPDHALIADVRVGEAPVGLALVGGGNRIIVADSNRFSAKGAASSLAVVAVRAGQAGRPALLGYLRAGGFPRQMALEPGGRALLVTNFTSGQLEVVTVARLP